MQTSQSVPMYGDPVDRWTVKIATCVLVGDTVFIDDASRVVTSVEIDAGGLLDVPTVTIGWDGDTVSCGLGERVAVRVRS